jgi:predicted nucleotidyltransferase
MNERAVSMQDNIRELLRKYREAIENVSDNHILKVVLYGSYARGDFRKDSDIDVMILMDIDETSSLIKQYENKICDVTYDFNMEYDTDIMPIVKDKRHFDYWKNAYLFYKNVDKEGVVI